MPRGRQTAAPPLAPAGETLGVFGGGQLGRMFCQAARGLGFRTHVYAPGGDCPAGRVADAHTPANYYDFAEVQRFARGAAAVTLESENVPVATVEAAGQHTPMRPAGEALFTVQDRAREKRFLVGAGAPVAPFELVRTEQELSAALAAVGLPAVLKTTRFGYDGKGQVIVPDATPQAAERAAAEAWAYLGRTRCVLERFIEFRRELSVIVARSAEGETLHCGPIENRHDRHILDTSVLPAACSGAVAAEATQTAERITRELEVVGVVCVEFFETTQGQLLANEIAPRTHNSGHLTIEACPASQFEQQVRAVAGLPLGSFAPRRPAAMANLLGDLWIPSGSSTPSEPNWDALDDFPEVTPHLYDKATPRRGRKMGHLTATADTPEGATAAVLAAREALATPC